MPRCSFLVPFCLLASLGSLPAQPANQDLPPPSVLAPANPTEDVKIGDRWTYEVRDEITGEVKATLTNVVTDMTKSEINVRVSATGKPNSGYLTYDRLWNLKDNGTWRITPNDGSGIRLPLEVGKEWSFQANLVNSTAQANFKQTGRAKIVGQESITTRAGTFDTFKIEESHTATGSNDPTKKIQVVQETWYAPQINYWVKRTFVSKAEGRTRESSSTELLEYGQR
jgi:hypothetical protein